jgi:D-3-phosphoglycerate dehydrogenase
MIDQDVLADELDGVEIHAVDTSDRDALLDAGHDAVGLVADVNTAVTEDVLDELPDPTVITRAGVGFENINVQAAADHGVRVMNVPEYCTDEVATHTDYCSDLPVIVATG